MTGPSAAGSVVDVLHAASLLPLVATRYRRAALTDAAIALGLVLAADGIRRAGR